MTRSLLAALAAALVLLAAAPSIRADDHEQCPVQGRLGAVCVGVDETSACGSAWFTGGATDFALGGAACAESRWYGPCASVLAGMGTLSGFHGLSAWACVVLAGTGLVPLAGCVEVADGRLDVFEPGCIPDAELLP